MVPHFTPSPFFLPRVSRLDIRSPAVRNGVSNAVIEKGGEFASSLTMQDVPLLGDVETCGLNGKKMLGILIAHQSHADEHLSFLLSGYRNLVAIIKTSSERFLPPCIKCPPTS